MDIRVQKSLSVGAGLVPARIRVRSKNKNGQAALTNYAFYNNPLHARKPGVYVPGYQYIATMWLWAVLYPDVGFNSIVGMYRQL